MELPEQLRWLIQQDASWSAVRFLCEIATARAAACVPFSWGAASRLPFLPRIRYGRTILAPARWRLSAADLPASTSSWREWVSGAAEWRHRLDVPAAVYVGDSDRRLILRLDETAHLSVLRVELDRAQQVVLREAPDADAFGWIDGCAHEIVVCLAAGAPPAPVQVRPRQVISCADYGHLPGESE